MSSASTGTAGGRQGGSPDNTILGNVPDSFSCSKKKWT